MFRNLWYLTNFYTLFQVNVVLNYMYLILLTYTFCLLKCFAWFLNSKLKLCWIFSCLVGFNIQLLGVLCFFLVLRWTGTSQMLFYVCSPLVFTLSIIFDTVHYICLLSPQNREKHNTPGKWIFKPIKYERIYIILTTLKIIWRKILI